MDIDELNRILKSGTREELHYFLKANNLEIVDGKIKAKDIEAVKEEIAFWDKRQLVKKINLNSLTV